jgi:iron complex outermembrane receptor protein
MTLFHLRRLSLVTAGILAQVVLSGTSYAELATEPAASDGLAEIIVTATRRQERLQDVPVSITAFTQEQMDAQGLRSVDDVTRLTPGVTFQRMGVSLSANYNDENSDINIRGVESQAGTSTTGIYIDDTPVQTRHIGFGAVNPYPALFDLDRVEVLRGPQGTLFGAGAEGGAVRFISPEPDLTRNSGYLRAEGSHTEGAANSFNFGAAAGGPIIDDVLAFRVSASFGRDGGYVDRVTYSHPGMDPLTVPTYVGTTEKNANWQETKTFRAALKWAPNDKLSITPSIYYQELQINDTAAYWMNLSDPSSDVFRNGNFLTNPSTDPFWLAAIKLNWNLGAAELTSNTSYFSRNQHSVSDYTQFWRVTFLGNSYPSQPGDKDYAPFGDKQSNFYQEIRLASTDTTARFMWNAGVFYSHMIENGPENIFDPTLNAEFTALTGGFPLCGAPGASVLGAPCPNGTLLISPVNKAVDRQIALFGEASYKVTDTLKATVGLRVAKADSAGTNLASSGGLVAPNLAGVTIRLNSPSEKPVTPKFVLAWQPDRDNMYYLSAAKGYRTGGVNFPVSFTCAKDAQALGLTLNADGTPHLPAQYSADSLWSYEIGGKNSWFDHRLQIDSSLFFINWKNIQQNVYLPTCGNQYVDNLGQVQSRGGDIAIQLRPIQSLTLGLTIGYTDAKFTKSSCANGLDFVGTKCVAGSLSVSPVVSEGDRLLGAPWTILASAEYSRSLAVLHGNTGYLRLDYQVTTAQTDLLAFQNQNNALYDNTIPSLPQINNLQLRAGVRWSGVDFSVFGNNLTNQHPLLIESRDVPAPSDNLYFGRTTRPRTIGLTASYRY